MCWVSWEHITKPKDLGGLDVRDLQLFNNALLAKQAWCIVTKPVGPLARGFLGKYCKKAPFLSMKPTKYCSHGWRSIIPGRDLLILKLGFVIGSGDSIKVWKDHWLSTDTHMTPYGPAPEKYQDMVVADLLTRETKEWNIEVVENVLLVDVITLLKPSITGGLDGMAWLGSQTGIYTTRSGYFTAVEHEQNLITTIQPTDWKKLIWA